MDANRPKQRVASAICRQVVTALIRLLENDNPFAVYDIYKASVDYTHEVSQRSADALRAVGLVTHWDSQTHRIRMTAETGVVVRAAVYKHGQGVAVRSHDQVMRAIGK